MVIHCHRRAVACCRRKTIYLPLQNPPRVGDFLHISANFLMFLLVLQPNNNCALRKWLVNNHFANGVHRHKSACHVFDAHHMRVDVRLHFASFKCKVAIYHLAIYKFQTFAVAKWLCANDGAVFKCQVFRIPSKVLALDCAVTYNNVFGMPKCVLLELLPSLSLNKATHSSLNLSLRNGEVNP